MNSEIPIISMVKIKELSEVKSKLRNPICIHGMPGMGMAGKTVLDHMIKILKPQLQKVCEIYSTSFPSNVFILENGIFTTPKIEVYAYINDTKIENDIILITGDTQPNSVVGTNNLSFYIAKIISELGVKELISLAATPITNPKTSPSVYITVTNIDLIEEFKKVGAKGPFIRGIITGMNGIIPGIAKFEFNIDGCTLLAETYPQYGKDFNASISLINIINKYLHLDVPVSELEIEAEKIDNFYKKMISRQRKREIKRKKKQDLGYIS
ncbi:MAG: PAC2 family protein [Candidatus Helarchaeota archaeon]